MMDKKKIVFFFFILLSGLQPLFSQDTVQQRRRQLIELIDEELREVVRLNRQIGSKNPTLLLRMAELYLEKARLVNEEENSRWLSLSPEQSRRMNQKEFFKKSRQYFLTAQKTCYFILKRFKRFKGRADVYYILAYNAKEYQQPKKAKSFFKKALKLAKNGSYTSIKTKLALAEMYYNEKRYKQAIPLYEQALKRKDQKWWTKDAYNLAWCYFRIDRKSQAINLMEEVHRLSGNATYVNVSSQVERDLAYFYSASGRSKDALLFYKKIGKDIGTNLLKVAKYLKGQGKYSAAEKALVQAKKNTPDTKTLILINVELLSLYERHGKSSKHLEVSNELYGAHKRGELNEQQLEDLKYHVAKMSALLQKQVVSKTYRAQKGTRRRKAKLATQYFQIQAGLSQTLNHKAIFHAAETQYSVKNFDDAADLYNTAYDQSVRVRDSRIATLSLDGLMASLGGRGVSPKTSVKYLTKAYSIYLKSNPRSKRSFKIYQRLFNQKMDAKDIAGAEQTLKDFTFHFPRSLGKQEAMLAMVIDFHKANKDKKKIGEWVGRINQGEFKVSKKFATKLRMILLSMQFDRVEKFNTKGDKVAALKGYLEIYKEPSSSQDARKNAAYNIAILFHELGNKEKTYGWSKRALSLMNSRDVKKFEDSFLLMATGLFNYREFQKSAEIYEIALEKLCKIKAKNKNVFFRNANIIYLAEGNSEKSAEIIEQSAKCRISYTARREARLELLNELAEQGRWSLFKRTLKGVRATGKDLGAIIYPLSLLREALTSRGRREEALEINTEMLTLFSKARARGEKIPLEALDSIARNYVEVLKRSAERLASTRLTFPEKQYNSLLKTKFKYLDEVTSRALDVFKIGSGDGIVEGYKILVEAYRGMGEEIRTFTPTGKGKDYVSSFKKSMSEISVPIERKANEFFQEARRQIMESKILSRSSVYFFTNKRLDLMPEFYPVKNGVLMDRGGRQ
jgi:tetratricopeptide (TPR) repeat protein